MAGETDWLEMEREWMQEEEQRFDRIRRRIRVALLEDGHGDSVEVAQAGIAFARLGLRGRVILSEVVFEFRYSEDKWVFTPVADLA